MSAPVFIESPRFSGTRVPPRDPKFSGATIAIESAGLSGFGSTAADTMYGAAPDTSSIAGKLYIAAPMVAAGGILGGFGFYAAGKKKTALTLGLLGLASGIYYGVIRRAAGDF